MHKAAHAFDTIRAAIFFTILGVTSYLSRTVTRPPWVGLFLLCTGSAIFELTLFALLPITEEARGLWPARLLLVMIAAMPAVAAVLVAVIANRKAPIMPEIEYPRARIPSIGRPLSRHNRFRDIHE